MIRNENKVRRGRGGEKTKWETCVDAVQGNCTATGMSGAARGSVWICADRDTAALMPAHTLGQAAGLASTFFAVRLHHPPLPLLLLCHLCWKRPSLFFIFLSDCCLSGIEQLPSLVIKDASRLCFLYSDPFQNQNYLDILQYIVFSRENLGASYNKKKEQMNCKGKRRNSGGNKITYITQMFLDSLRESVFC